MRLEKQSGKLLGAVLAFVMGFCAMACVVSAFQMGVSLWGLALWCAVAAVVSALCFHTRLGFVVPALFVVAALWLLFAGKLVDSAESFCYYLSRMWRGTYGWKIFRWSHRTADEMALTLAPVVYLLGAGAVSLCSWGASRPKHTWVALLAAVSCLGLCLSLPANTPGVLWVIGLFFSGALLLLTAPARRRDPRQGQKAMLYTAIPLILAISILFITVSPVAYTGDRLANSILESRAFRTAWAALTGQRLADDVDTQAASVDLTKVGPQGASESVALYVTANYTGTLYIRGSALDTYDGLRWSDSGQGSSLSWPGSDKLTSIGEVMVSTRYAHRMLYLPYYTTSINLNGISRGVVNETQLTTYSVACATAREEVLQELYPSAGENRHTVAADTMAQCTELPDATRRWAQRVLKDAVSPGTVSYYHKAQEIGDYVKNSASYDLVTPTMPATSQDFAQWFLQDSDTGYCVHFASAATVLLKAAGIPARYVTGYRVQVENGTMTAVLQKNSHAWVEYWLPGYGWTILEPTPAAEPAPEEETAPVVPDSWDGSLPAWTWIALVAFGALSLLGGILQWPVRLYLRDRKLYRGSLEQQILGRWYLIEIYCRLMKIAPDRELFFLAQRAKFSPHPMTEEDLDRFDYAVASLKRRLRKRNLFLQIYDRLILALY